MALDPTFDLASAHRYFAAHCYNEVWRLLENSERTPAQDREMLALAFASIYHWEFRPDVTDEKRSIGLWQLSRVYATLGDGSAAKKYALDGLALFDGVEADPFYLGYLYEALARAEKVIGNTEGFLGARGEARRLCAEVSDEESREMLDADLRALGG